MTAFNPTFQHGKNAFLAFGYEAPAAYQTALTPITGSFTTTTATVNFNTHSLFSSHNELIAGQGMYGMFVNGVPTWTTTTPVPGTSTAYTLGTAVQFSGSGSGAVCLPMVNISQYINDISLPWAIEAAETTTFSPAGVKTYIAGLKGGTITFSGFYDPTPSAGDGYSGGIDKMMADMEGFQDWYNNSVFVQFVYGPSNPGSFQAATGNYSGAASPKYYGQGIITKYDLKSGVNGVVTFDSELQITGAVVRANI